MSALDRLDVTQRQLRKAAARLFAGDQSAAAEAKAALRTVASIVKELEVQGANPGLGVPLKGGSGEELVLGKSGV